MVGRETREETHPRHVAVDALLETAGRYPGEVELVALGPLINVAMALHREPLLAGKVKGCVMMCRASDHLGNITPVAEYNVWVDPEAAKVVFSSGMPLKMVGLDVSRKHASFTSDEAAELRGAGTPWRSSPSTSRGSPTLGEVMTPPSGGSSLRTR
jgi:purine nucleosidase